MTPVLELDVEAPTFRLVEAPAFILEEAPAFRPVEEAPPTKVAGTPPLKTVLGPFDNCPVVAKKFRHYVTNNKYSGKKYFMKYLYTV